MPYTFDILIPNSVLYQATTGDQSLEEIAAVMKEFVQFLDSCEPNEGIILTNMTHLKSIPIKLLDLRDVTAPLLRHENYKAMVGYGSSDKVVINFLANAVAGIFKQPIKMFATEAEALKYIIGLKPALAESLPEALRQVQNARK
jgi:hypothetical protein